MSFEIAKGGIAKCEIVIRKNSKPPERFAALELPKYLRKITGGQFQVRDVDEKRKSTSARTHFGEILIGAARESLSKEQNSEDGFSITRVLEGLTISGDSPRGTLFGVYWLIRKLGVSFLAPEFDYYNRLGGTEFVTVNPNLQVPETCFGTHTPVFEWRPKDIGEGASHTNSNILQLIDWMAKMGHNILRCPSQGEGTHSNPHKTSWDAWRDLLTPELKKRGILIQVGQHGYQNYLSSEKYFRTNPEWFGELDAKRLPMGECVFCTSNSDALQEFTSNVISYLKARPEIDIFDLWPPDAVPWCTCPSCEALGSESERHALLVETIRSVMKKELPNVKLGILAYVHYTEFPERTPISPEVRLDFCPIYRDYSSPLNDPDNPFNKTEYWDKLLRWKNGWQGEVEIYEYYMKYRFRSFPIAMPRLIAEEHAVYKKLGIRGISNYSEPDTWLAYEISHYLLAICGWNGIVEADKEVNCWARLRVGEGLADRLSEALKLIEVNFRYLYSGHFGFHPLCATGKLVIAENKMHERVRALKRAREILDEIAVKASSPGSRSWIEHLRRALHYAICDFEVQLAWDRKDTLAIALENYHKSLDGPQEEFDGVIHYGEAGRRELKVHYDSHTLKPHW